MMKQLILSLGLWFVLQSMLWASHKEDDRCIATSSTSHSPVASVPDWSEIPEEIWVHSFQFITNQEDLLRASHVCRQWRKAAYATGTIDDGRTLNIYKKQLSEKVCEALREVPFARFLLVDCQMTKEQLHILTQFNQIKGLGLIDTKLTIEEAKLLANMQSLTELILHHNNLEDKSIKILSTGNLQGLTALEFEANKIGDEGLRALSTGNLHGLTTLILTISHRFGNEGLRALSTGNLYKLMILDLSSNDIGDEGVKILCAGNLRGLKTLRLTTIGIGDEGAKAIAEAPFLSLVNLYLSFNSIGDEGVKAIAVAPFLALERLVLMFNAIGPEGAEAIAAAWLPALTDLNLSGNNIGEEGRKALAKNPRLRH